MSQESGNITPPRILVLLVAVLTPLICLMLVWPSGNVHLGGDLTLKWPTFRKYFFSSSEGKNIDDIINALDEDSTKKDTKIVNRQQALADSLRRAGMKLQYPNGDKTILYPLFAALETSGSGDKPVHIMHYGDSQIEGDRMTSVIRNELQSRFGGSGPGLLPVVPAVPPFSVTLEQSENWTRFTGFGTKNPAIQHNRYGLMISYARFAWLGPVKDSTDEKIGWVKVLPNSGGYARNRNYTRARFLYGYNNLPVTAQVFADGALLITDTLRPQQTSGSVTWTLPSSPAEMTVILRGADSPDCYGMSLETPTGICVDNIAMRGNSGTHFGTVDGSMLARQYTDLNVKLFILQYGGNVVPYIDGPKETASYGNNFKNQIELLKRLNPGAAVIVIGPADMSIKENEQFVTHPHLEPVRDALKQAAFDAGAAYFDLYTVMGGRNSMPAWVNANPPLAAPDYIHYSPAGAKKVAEAFIKSLMEDYEVYRKRAPAVSAK